MLSLPDSPPRKDLQLRPYQARLDVKVFENWGRHSSQLIASPMGSGKTVMGIKAAARFVNEVAPALHNCHPSEVGVYWMAMRSNLLIQSARENEAFAPEGQSAFCPNFHTVSSFASSVPHLDRYKVRLLVCDEAHHSSTSSEMAVISVIKPQAMLGLSATPKRSDRSLLTFEKTHRDAWYRSLIRDGYLSRFNHWSLQEWSVESSVAAFVENPEQWGHSLFFYRTGAECERAAQLLARAGFRSHVVRSGTDRQAQIADFEATGAPLISMPILTEGFDCPRLKSVFTRDCLSEGATHQMCGRALRLHAESPLKNIVQSIPCKYPFIKEAEAANRFIQRNGKWSAVTASERAREARQDVERRILSSPVMPKLPLWDVVRKSCTFHGMTEIKTRRSNPDRADFDSFHDGDL